MKSLFTLALCLLLGMIAQPALSQQPDSAAVVTLLGNDTLAVERWVRTAQGMQAEVLLRVPTLTLRKYQLDLAADGTLQGWTQSVYPAPQWAGPPAQVTYVVLDGDSLVVSVQDAGETRVEKVAGHGLVLPFFDMIHWPFELMLMRAHATGQVAGTQDLLAGRNVRPFAIETGAPGRMAVTHPTRGTMQVHVDALGRLQSLDASATTRKVRVERRPWLDLTPLQATFAGRNAFGALSGRGTFKRAIQGANVLIDYGTPTKRGREVWGKLVPWGQRWRTGANRATHFTIDQDVIIGDLPVPAGTYTLYCIPEPEGGTLIINKQTGQTGTSYDEAQDLGRVPLFRTTLSEPVETFTIEIAEEEQSATLRLVWDQSAFVVPLWVPEP